MRGSRHAPRQTNGSRSRIVRRPDVWGGKAVVEGTRVPVFMVHARLQSGWGAEEIREAYPRLSAGDVEAVILYAQAYPEQVLADRRVYQRSLPPEGARTARISRTQPHFRNSIS